MRQGELLRSHWGYKTHWFFAALIPFLFPVIAKASQNVVGHAFTSSAVMMVMQVVVVWNYFPETKVRTLEDIGEHIL